MLNMFTVVGRIYENITDENIKVAVSRAYKNIDGVYETDILTIVVKDYIFKNVQEYCNKGDLLGVKGRIETIDGNMVLFAEKISFLSQRKENE